MSQFNSTDLDGKIERIAPSGLAPGISDYVDVVRAGDFVFISGFGPLDVQGKVVGAGDVVRQAEQVFENMTIALESVGADFENVVKVVVYLADVDDRQAVNGVRRRYFGPHWPASTLFGVGSLALPDMLIEVEATAYVPQQG